MYRIIWIIWAVCTAEGPVYRPVNCVVVVVLCSQGDTDCAPAGATCHVGSHAPRCTLRSDGYLRRAHLRPATPVGAIRSAAAGATYGYEKCREKEGEM